jgi:hypothetical protein
MQIKQFLLAKITDLINELGLTSWFRLEVFETVPPNLGPAEEILGPVIPLVMPEKIYLFYFIYFILFIYFIFLSLISVKLLLLI